MSRQTLTHGSRYNRFRGVNRLTGGTERRCPVSARVHAVNLKLGVGIANFYRQLHKSFIIFFLSVDDITQRWLLCAFPRMTCRRSYYMDMWACELRVR